MLNVYVPEPQGLALTPVGEDFALPPGTVWVDLLEPTIAEEKSIEAQLGIEIPTREEMTVIEASNRLYEENDEL